MRLAEHDDMPRAWRELRKRGISAGWVFSTVRKAFEAAHKEVKREAQADEDQKLAAVRGAIAVLREAIEVSPLPREHGALVQISRTSNGVEMLERIVLGWRDPSPDSEFLGYNITMLQVLDQAVGMLDSFEQRRFRLVERQSKGTRREDGKGGDPVAKVFVRYLCKHLEAECGDMLYGTVAHLANAALYSVSALRKDDVKGMMAAAKKRAPKKSP